MNLWESLKKVNSIDYTPEFTRFMTRYIMPIIIVLCGYAFWYISQLLNESITEFTNIKTSISELKLEHRGNNKPIESIYTDLTLTTTEGLRLHRKNLGKYSKLQLSKNLAIADKVEIFYVDKTGIIKELRQNGKSLISYQSELERKRKGRNTTGLFFLVFLFWYISRMYRYRKYGTI